MNGFTFALTCPTCGAPVEVVNIGKVCAGTETRAIVRCTKCDPRAAEFVVELFVRRVVVRTDRQPCGSSAAYFRHLRNKEPVDEACMEAHRRYVSPDGVNKTVLRGRLSGLEERRTARREALAIAGEAEEAMA